MSCPEIFTAVVVTSNAGSNAVTVHRETYSGVRKGDMGHMMQAVPLSSVMSTYLGFKESILPQPGSRVLCISDSVAKCFILGTITPENIKMQNTAGRAMLGAKNALADQANRVGHEEYTPTFTDNRRPTDVVDGEHVISNEFGVLLGLYQQLANLKASELAQVQCFLLDDMVRIISHNFQHYTAIGEYNIWHDGKKIMAEFGATHKASEAYGVPAVNSDSGSPTFTEEGSHDVKDNQDYYKIQDDERSKAVERFKLFLGSVGDFLHLFVVRPDPSNKPKLNQQDPSKPDTGLCDIHIGTDGGLHLRSVKEVFLEKTHWIRVPHRKSAPEDPEGDDGESLEYEKKQKFNFQNSYKYKGNPFTYALQIRDYVAFVNEKCGYSNFKKHNKDFFVNDSIDNENSLKSFGPIDKDTDLYQQDYELRSAGIYIMPNGGITIRDAWNSAIVLEGGNVYIQPAKDIIQQPLRSFIVKAGAHINMDCKKHIDLSSTKEAVRIKSEKSQYFYSEKGGIVMETKGEEDNTGKPDPKEQAIEEVGGIVFKSKLSIYNYAEKDIVNYAKKKVLFQSLENMDLIAPENTITMYARDAVHVLSDDTISTYGAKTNLHISDGSVILAGAGATVLGHEEQNLGIMYDDKSMFIDILKGVFPTTETTEELSKIKKVKDDILKQVTFYEVKKFEDLQFHFLKSDKYEPKLKPNEDAIPASLAQQEDKLTGAYSLSTWEQEEINKSLPYPGKEMFENFFLDAEKPNNLEANGMGKDYSSKAESTPSPATVTLKSLKQYKIQS
jgi:hypothetical protein